MTDEVKKYCEGIDCSWCNEKEPCIYKIANKLEEQLKRKEQKLKKIAEFRHNYCMNCEDLLKPSHSCKGCNMVELKRLIEGRDNG